MFSRNFLAIGLAGAAVCGFLTLVGICGLFSGGLLLCMAGGVVATTLMALAAFLYAGRLERQTIAALSAGMRSTSTDLSFVAALPSAWRPFADALKELRARQNDMEERFQAEQSRTGSLEQTMTESSTQKEAQSARFSALDTRVRETTDKASVACEALARELRGLSSRVAKLGEGAEIQRFHLKETTKTMDLMAENVGGISRSVNIASEQAESSRSRAQNSAREMDDTVADIERVKGVTLELREAMGVMEAKTKDIHSVMGVISEVADQTNLLALNAAIEAARAGEAGRGFAVVADEVRKLAEKTMRATTEVHEVLAGIQSAASSNRQTVSEAADLIVRSAERASQVGVAMNQIVTEIDSTAVQFGRIAKAADEQLDSSIRSNRALDDIFTVAADTADQVQHFTANLVHIISTMDDLDGFVYSYTHDTDSGRLMQWTPDLDTGITLIDDQHKMLCAYINSLHRAMARGTLSSVGRDIVANLKNYTVTHFSTEEGYFSRSGYPDTDKHMQTHHKFVEKVTQVEEQFAAGRTQVGAELLEFLKTWLCGHIQGTDRQYVPFVKTLIAEEQAAHKHKTHE